MAIVLARCFHRKCGVHRVLGQAVHPLFWHPHETTSNNMGHHLPSFLMTTNKMIHFRANIGNAEMAASRRVDQLQGTGELSHG